MIKRFISAQIDKAEKQLGESHEYLRYMLKTSLPAFLTFSKIFKISNYRKKMPTEGYHLSRIVAAQDEDCGSCVQLEINIALQAGVSPSLIQSVIDEKPDQLPENLKLVYLFTESIIRKEYDNELKEKFIVIYGETELIELALGVASSRFMPVVKRTLGYATSCQKISLTARPGPNNKFNQ